MGGFQPTWGGGPFAGICNPVLDFALRCGVTDVGLEEVGRLKLRKIPIFGKSSRYINVG